MKKPSQPRIATRKQEKPPRASSPWKAPVALLPSMAIGMGAATAGQQGVATVHAWNLLAMVGVLAIWVLLAAVRMVRGRGLSQGMMAAKTWQLLTITGALLLAAPFSFLGGRSGMQTVIEMVRAVS